MVLWWQCAAGMDGWGGMQAKLEMTALMIPPLSINDTAVVVDAAPRRRHHLWCVYHISSITNTHSNTNTQSCHHHQHQHPESSQQPNPNHFLPLLAGSAPALATAPAAAANGGRGGAGQGGGGRRGRQGGSGSYFKQHIILRSSTSLVQDIVLVVGVVISSRSVEDGPVVAM